VAPAIQPVVSTVAAGLVPTAAVSDEERRRWLEPLASGEARGTLAVWDEGAGWSPDRSEVESTNVTLSAVKTAVPDAGGADFVLVAGADGSDHLVETCGAARIVPDR